jgi:hypothetical protein
VGSSTEASAKVGLSSVALVLGGEERTLAGFWLKGGRGGEKLNKPGIRFGWPGFFVFEDTVRYQMNLQKMRLRVRQFNPEIDKFEDLVEVDRKILKDEKNHLDISRTKECEFWIKQTGNLFD